MNIIGNVDSQKLIENNLFENHTNIISGPSHIGKSTFIKNKINSCVDENDIFIADTGIDSTREAISFSLSHPSFSDQKVLILDIDTNISDASQDAYLKLCEEPPPYLFIYFITEDYNSLFSTLLSRFSCIYLWRKLNDKEMDEFIKNDSLSPDKDACFLSDGRPGLYNTISSTVELKELYSDIRNIYLNEFEPILSDIPAALKDLKDTNKRDAVISICDIAAKSLLNEVSKERLSSLFEYISNLKKFPSINSEIHWVRHFLM